nr:gliding motility-associated C-terminal domain-containing protein [uncultured Capnocytophaga sp.]
MKVKSLCKWWLCILLVSIGLAEEIHAQSQGRLLWARRDFKDACASSLNNGNVIVEPRNPNDPSSKDKYGFKFTFRWNPPFPNGNNQFIIELSDPNGDFSSPTVLRTISNKNTAAEIETNIIFPTNTFGDRYRIRVRSTNPASEVIATHQNNSGTEYFKATYANVTSRITIAPTNIVLCGGQSQEIKVVSLPTGEPVSKYQYIWYKDGSTSPIATGPDKITVTQAGKYYALINYACGTNNNTRSPNATVSVSGSQAITLAASNTDICENEAFTLTATPQDPNAKYFWYRNGTKIQETSEGVNTYTVPVGQNLAGKYYVQVGSGGTCDSRSNEVEIKRKDAITASLAANGGDVLMPGASKTLNVTTTAQGATYKWFKDGAEISGVAGATYSANAVGKYKVEITQTSGCSGSVTTNEVELKAPDNFKVSIKTKNAYQPCTSNAVTLSIDKIVAIAGGTELTVGASEYSFFTFQWEGNTSGSYTDLSGETNTELNLNSATQNGKYRLKTTATGFSSIPVSNELNITLQDANALKINNGNPSLDYCDGTATLSVTTGGNASSTYTWFKDNVQIARGVGMTEYVTDGSGVFYATVESNGGGCPATSNSVVVKKTTVTARWADDINTREIYYHGKTNVLTVSHNMISPTIEWRKNGTVLTGETGTQLTISSAPTSVDIYTVKLTDTGNCGTVKTLDPIYFENIADIKQVKVGTLPSTDCETRSQTVLEVQKILVQLSSSGQEIEVKKSDYQYFNYQWTKDGTDIFGETNKQLTVLRAGNSESAKYAVRVTYNTSIIKSSDERAIAFTPIPDFEIASSEGAKNTVYLCQGGSVTLTVAPDSFDPNSSVADSFSYKWYKVTSANYSNDTAIGSENPTANVNAIGEYYLEINNGGCPKRAHIKVENYRLGMFDLGFKGKADNSPVVKVKQERVPTRTISAQVGEHIVALKKTDKDDEVEIAGGNFVWVKDDGTEKYGSILNIDSEDMAGNYTLKETSCPAIGENAINFVLKVYKVDKIPNIVTPNGDLINDKWIIPSIYSQPNVRVTIYSQEGKEVLSTTNYQNNWPDERTYKDLGKRALIFMYVIEGGEVEKQKGTITILK